MCACVGLSVCGNSYGDLVIRGTEFELVCLWVCRCV